MKKTGLSLLLCAALPAFAGEAYVGLGLPGITLGFAQPVSETFTLRADVSTLGSLNRQKNQDGIAYDARVKLNQLGLFADAFVYGQFRVTGGLTINDARADLAGQGNGGTITIGGFTHSIQASDRFDVEVKFPRTMPYIGVGYGHGLSDDAGWHFAFDAGIALGKPKVSATVSGSTLPQAVSQADIDKQLAGIRDDADKIKGIPRLSFSVNYRF